MSDWEFYVLAGWFALCFLAQVIVKIEESIKKKGSVEETYVWARLFLVFMLYGSLTLCAYRLMAS